MFHITSTLFPFSFTLCFFAQAHIVFFSLSLLKLCIIFSCSLCSHCRKIKSFSQNKQMKWQSGWKYALHKYETECRQERSEQKKIRNSRWPQHWMEKEDLKDETAIEWHFSFSFTLTVIIMISEYIYMRVIIRTNQTLIFHVSHFAGFAIR